jgi:hypothetical protein
MVSRMNSSKIIGRPFLYDWCFPDRIPNVTFDGVLMLLHTIALKLQSHEKRMSVDVILIIVE